MTEPVTVRPYCGADEAALLDLWNETLTRDRIDAARFRTQVLLDANFDPAGLLLAEVEGQPAGFVLSIVRQTPLFLQGLEPELAWITAFGVRPAWQRQGIGRPTPCARSTSLRTGRTWTAGAPTSTWM